MRQRKFEAANVAPGDLLRYIQFNRTQYNSRVRAEESKLLDVIMILSCKIHGNELTLVCSVMRFSGLVQEIKCDLRQFCLDAQNGNITNLTRDS